LTLEAEAVAGDASAFGALVEQHQQVAFRAAYLIVRDAQAAEDVAQEAFIRAYRSMHKFRTSDPFRPWLLRIVTNLALNHARSQQRQRGLFDRIVRLRAETAPPTAPPMHDALAALDEASRLARAINELPPDDRVVLYLRYFLELPEREIATTIGKAPGTVKSRLHRAGARLRDVIRDRYPELMERSDG
jgi:RNA polymerase sigma-70 factor (ECF subfamily)